MKVQTLKSIINAFQTASKDATRFHINHVLIEADPLNDVRIVATNGHALSVVTLDDSCLRDAIAFMDATEKKQNRYIVQMETLPILKLLLKNNKKMINIPISRLATGEIEVNDGTYKVQFKTEKSLQIDFPKYDSFFGSKKPVAFEIGFNAKTLLDLIESMQVDSVDQKTGKPIPSNFKGCHLVMTDKLSPIMVKVGSQMGVLMPMRI